MQFLWNWSWWLLEVAQMGGLMLSGLWTFKGDSELDPLGFAGMVLTLLVLAVQWFLHGFLGFAVATLVTTLVIRPLANNWALCFLGSRGIIHMDPEVAFDITRAENLREKRQRRFRRLLGSRPWEAFQATKGGVQEEVAHGKAALSFLGRPEVVRELDLGSEDIERLVKTIQRFLGPIKPQTIVKIATNPATMTAYRRYKASGEADDTELYCAILLGHLRS